MFCVRPAADSMAGFGSAGSFFLTLLLYKLVDHMEEENEPVMGMVLELRYWEDGFSPKHCGKRRIMSSTLAAPPQAS